MDDSFDALLNTLRTGDEQSREWAARRLSSCLTELVDADRSALADALIDAVGDPCRGVSHAAQIGVLRIPRPIVAAAVERHREEIARLIADLRAEENLSRAVPNQDHAAGDKGSDEKFGSAFENRCRASRSRAALILERLGAADERVISALLRVPADETWYDSSDVSEFLNLRVSVALARLACHDSARRSLQVIVRVGELEERLEAAELLARYDPPDLETILDARLCRESSDLTGEEREKLCRGIDDILFRLGPAVMPRLLEPSLCGYFSPAEAAQFFGRFGEQALEAVPYLLETLAEYLDETHYDSRRRFDEAPALAAGLARISSDAGRKAAALVAEAMHRTANFDCYRRLIGALASVGPAAPALLEAELARWDQPDSPAEMQFPEMHPPYRAERSLAGALIRIIGVRGLVTLAAHTPSVQAALLEVIAERFFALEYAAQSADPARQAELREQFPGYEEVAHFLLETERRNAAQLLAAEWSIALPLVIERLAGADAEVGGQAAGVILSILDLRSDSCAGPDLQRPVPPLLADHPQIRAALLEHAVRIADRVDDEIAARRAADDHGPSIEFFSADDDEVSAQNMPNVGEPPSETSSAVDDEFERHRHRSGELAYALNDHVRRLLIRCGWFGSPRRGDWPPITGSNDRAYFREYVSEIRGLGEVESVPVMSLALWPGTIRALESAGLNTAGDIARRSLDELGRIHGLNKHEVREVSERMEDLGLSLRRDE